MIHGSLKNFQRATGVAAELIPVALPDQCLRFGEQKNEFCRALACSACCCKACYHHQVELLRRTNQKLKPAQNVCLAGMVHLAVPVIVTGRHVATIFGGQVCAQPPTETRFDLLAARLRKWGLNGEISHLRRAWFCVPRLTPPQLHAAVGLLDKLARLFAEVLAHQPATIFYLDPPCVAEARQFIRLNLGERITTRDAAKALQLTESHFCRLFRRFTGKTFHEYLAQVRTEAAKVALAETHRPISQIAMDAGFQSISDFNRVFKARAEVTPSAFRLSHRNGVTAA